MKPENYVPHLHNTNYQEEFEAKPILADSLLSTEGREMLSLNGPWRFTVDPYDTCLRARWFEERGVDESGRKLPLDYDFDAWQTIQVPSCWNLASDRLFHYEGPAVYTRTFDYQLKDSARVFLYCQGISYRATVFLNARFLGLHRGASTPFCVEVTELLQEKNRLLIVVDNTRREDQVPMSNTDWFNYGGIYRRVSLVKAPRSFIRDFSLRLVKNSNFSRIEAEVATCEDPGGKEQNPEQAVVEIPELDVRIGISIKDGRGSVTFSAQPKLWSPEQPRLYTVKVNYRKDSISDRVGFREIRVEGGNILLNGRPYFLKGVSCHEESLTNGKSLTPEEIRQNFSLAKELNCNFMRLAHYPHAAESARIADEVGILLWEEIPVYWDIQFNNPKTYADAENQLSELILRDKNRASVVIWSVGNENADTDARLGFMRRLADKARRLDPDRLVSAACLVNKTLNRIQDRLTQHLDLIGVNEYYGWYDPDFSKLVQLFENSRPDKPVIITEFGAAALKGKRGEESQLFSEDCQKKIYERQTETLKAIDYVKGMSPWILYDFRCPRRRNSYQQGYNRKGLLSEDKQYRKPAFWVLKRFYESDSN